jgi:RHS repeat-associated protein
MVPVTTGTESVRERFTGKEYDKDGGTGNGVDGIRLNYFGARYYDPEVGGWTANDPSEQFWSPYGYAGSGTNPIIMVDENGEFLLQAYWLYKTFKPKVYWSSERKGIGFDVTWLNVGIPGTPLNYKRRFGATYYWEHYDQSYEGWETRNSGTWSLGPFDLSGTKFKSGETSQTTRNLTVHLPMGYKAQYENDGAWQMLGLDKVPGIPYADDQDRYRTGAGRLSWGPLAVGFNLFTGDPGVPKRWESIRGNETYIPHDGYNPNKYRAGILYFQIGGFRIGRNSENIRCVIQNEIVHDRVTGGEAKWFEVLKGENEWYYGYESESEYTIW